MKSRYFPPSEDSFKNALASAPSNRSDELLEPANGDGGESGGGGEAYSGADVNDARSEASQTTSPASRDVMTPSKRLPA